MGKPAEPLPAITGTWSTAQANDLGRQPHLDSLRTKCQVLSTSDDAGRPGALTSVARVVEALNEGSINVSGGLCVLFSASKETYWLLWRSDQEKYSETITTAAAG